MAFCLSLCTCHLIFLCVGSETFSFVGAYIIPHVIPRPLVPVSFARDELQKSEPWMDSSEQEMNRRKEDNRQQRMEAESEDESGAEDVTVEEVRVCDC